MHARTKLSKKLNNRMPTKRATSLHICIYPVNITTRPTRTQPLCTRAIGSHSSPASHNGVCFFRSQMELVVLVYGLFIVFACFQLLLVYVYFCCFAIYSQRGLRFFSLFFFALLLLCSVFCVFLYLFVYVDQKIHFHWLWTCMWRDISSI